MAEPILEFEIRGKNATFRSLDEVKGWVAKEKKAYEVLLGAPGACPPAAQARDQFKNFLSQIEQFIQSYHRKSHDYIQLAQTINRNAPNAFYAISTTIDGKAIVNAQELGGDVAAGFCAITLGLPNVNLAQFTGPSMQGALLAVLHKDGIGKMSTKAIKDAAKAAEAEHAKFIKAREEEFSNLITQIEKDSNEQLTEQKADYQKILAETMSDTLDLRNKAESAVNAAIESISATEKKYDDFMENAAGKDYWSLKAEKHEKNKQTNGIVVLIYAVISIFILTLAYITAYIKIAELVSSPDKTPYLPETILLGTALFLLTSILVWTGRILLRNYLSEKHLAFDARERETMAITYQALIHKDLADASDRAIVLNALFRSTEDGIVDDAAPDLIPSAVLSRLTK